MTAKPTVLFISALDFKEKSIQVLRKTPEAYVRRGWHVIYLVARDDSRRGDYFYERVINPEGLEIIRVGTPLAGIHGACAHSTLRTIIGKFRSYATIVTLGMRALRICRTRHVDIVYGYEAAGVLAYSLVRWLCGKKRKFITRFQGSFIADMVQNRRYLKLLMNWEFIWAMRVHSDLVIVTDDGTQGDRALEYVRSSHKNVRFWTNGVDQVDIPEGARERVRRKLALPPDAKLLVSVSRLVLWKRVERCLEVLSKAVRDHGLEDLHYAVIGDGEERARLEGIATSLGIADRVHWLGAVPQAEVREWQAGCDAFISMYDASNVGNPLLEAIRAHAIILTLDNGDTSRWIKHAVNGFIYQIDEGLTDRASADLARVLCDNEFREAIKDGVRQTEKQMLWPWEQRMDAEVNDAAALLSEDSHDL